MTTINGVEIGTIPTGKFIDFGLFRGNIYDIIGTFFILIALVTLDFFIIRYIYRKYKTGVQK